MATIKVESKMESLPTEMILRIFSNLHLNDLLQCRQVNRKCKYVVDNEIKIVQIAIRSDEEARFSKHFFDLNYRSIELGHQMRIGQADTHCNLFNSGLVVLDRLLKNLRWLFIDQHCVKRPNALFSVLAGINQLTELEQLEIRSIRLERPDALQLPKLRILSIGRLTGRSLRLSTPLLEQFATEGNLEMFEFEYPKRLTRLSTYKFEEINQFVNLTHLYVRNFEYDSDPVFRIVPVDILTLLPKLQEIHCRNWTRQLLVFHILDHRNMLRRKEFKFVQFGIPIDSLDQLAEFAANPHDNYLMDGDLQDYFRLMLRNYPKLTAQIPWATKVFYDDFVGRFSGRTEEERLEADRFFERFMNIQTVIVNRQVEDPMAFTRFIKKCKEIKELELREAGLGATFFDQLVRYQPLIESLEIKSSTPLAIDLKFVLKFRHLKSFQTNQPINFEVLKQLLDTHRFYDFQFVLMGKSVSLCPLEHEITIDEDDPVELLNHSQMIDFLRKLMMICEL